MLSHPGVVQCTRVTNLCLKCAKQSIEPLPVLCVSIDSVRGQEVRAHSHKCGFWPRKEPIDVHAEHRGEFLCADGKLRIHWGEAQRDVQVITKPAQKVSVHIEQVLLEMWAIFDKVIPDLTTHTIFFILCKESNHLSSGNDGVDDLQKIFALHLCICEYERDVLTLLSSTYVQASQIFKESIVVVALRDSNLESPVARCECCQS
mmetsp:Transcript_96588/g.171055  ORF Transcript_96588/g.171055 Transcript_96588/m.171055 type:complete len:204 (-) Transcript_96588:3130-3741(-)